MNLSEFDEEYDDYLRGAEHHLISGAILKDPLSRLEPRPPVTVSRNATVAECIDKMCRGSIGCVLVTEDGAPVGIVTERDILKKIAGPRRDPASTTAEEIMTPDPECLETSERVVVALNRMMVGGYRHIPVVDSSGRAVGILSVRNFVRFIVSLYPEAVLNQPPSARLKHPETVDGG